MILTMGGSPFCSHGDFLAIRYLLWLPTHLTPLCQRTHLQQISTQALAKNHPLVSCLYFLIFLCYFYSTLSIYLVSHLCFFDNKFFFNGLIHFLYINNFFFYKTPFSSIKLELLCLLHHLCSYTKSEFCKDFL